MVTGKPEPSPARPRVLACARRTARLCLAGLVIAAVVLCWGVTALLQGAERGITWLTVAHLACLVLLLGAVLLISRASTAFLEAAYHQQDRVVSAVAHELRSPLSRMLASVEEGLCGLADERDALTDARREARNLAQLLDDLLLAGQVLAGVVPVPCEPVRIDPVLAWVPDLLPLGDASVVVEAEPLVLAGSERLLRLSVVNLVRNAVQHAYAGGPGRIRVVADPDGVAVIDDGPGIPEERLQALVRVPCVGPSRRRAGLGLLLAEWVAELHGGELRLSNRPEGGFEARLVLPVEQVAARLNGHVWVTSGARLRAATPATRAMAREGA